MNTTIKNSIFTFAILGAIVWNSWTALAEDSAPVTPPSADYKEKLIALILRSALSGTIDNAKDANQMLGAAKVQSDKSIRDLIKILPSSDKLEKAIEKGLGDNSINPQDILDVKGKGPLLATATNEALPEIQKVEEAKKKALEKPPTPEPSKTDSDKPSKERQALEKMMNDAAQRRMLDDAIRAKQAQSNPITPGSNGSPGDSGSPSSSSGSNSEGSNPSLVRGIHDSLQRLSSNDNNNFPDLSKLFHDNNGNNNNNSKNNQDAPYKLDSEGKGSSRDENSDETKPESDASKSDMNTTPQSAGTPNYDDRLKITGELSVPERAVRSSSSGFPGEYVGNSSSNDNPLGGLKGGPGNNSNQNNSAGDYVSSLKMASDAPAVEGNGKVGGAKTVEFLTASAGSSDEGDIYSGDGNFSDDSKWKVPIAANQILPIDPRGVGHHIVEKAHGKVVELTCSRMEEQNSFCDHANYEKKPGQEALALK